MGNKAVVVGMKERGGKLAMRVVESRTRRPMEAHIHASIAPGTTISSDEFGSYRFLGQQGYRHITVSHKSGAHVGTTNSIEGVWAALKRSINGTHIHVSSKHLPKYLAEHEYRHNMRHLPHLMIDRPMFSFAR